MAKKGEGKTAPREYVVMKRSGPLETTIHGSFMATSASRAIDMARKGEGGRWVAVPERNWTEEDLTIEQRTVTHRQKIHSGQTQIEVPAAEAAAA